MRLQDNSDVFQNAEGRYFNARLSAPNVWELEVDPMIIDEAASIYKGIRWKQELVSGCRFVVEGSGLAFFTQKPEWNSDISWLSVDNEACYDVFLSIFTRLGIAQLFEPLVVGSVRLYSASYVCMCCADG